MFQNTKKLSKLDLSIWIKMFFCMKVNHDANVLWMVARMFDNVFWVVLVCWVLLQLVFFFNKLFNFVLFDYEIHITLSRKHVSMSLICFTVLIRCRHSTLKYEKPSLHLLYTV